MVRAGHKFDFSLFINETPNKWRPVKGHTIAPTYVFGRMYTCSPNSRREGKRTVPTLCRSAAFSCVKDSSICAFGKSTGLPNERENELCSTE